MRSKRVTLQLKREFSDEFKKNCVIDYENGKLTIKELSSLYKINETVIYRWVYKFSTYNKKKVRIVEMEESSTLKIKELYSKIQELERIIGQKQIKVDYLEKMIELASEELKVDIKKNFDQLPCNGSRNTSIKPASK